MIFFAMQHWASADVQAKFLSKIPWVVQALLTNLWLPAFKASFEHTLARLADPHEPLDPPPCSAWCVPSSASMSPLAYSPTTVTAPTPRPDTNSSMGTSITP
jgi:hypothetical protein